MKKLLIFLSVAVTGCTGIQPRYHEVAAGETWEAVARRYAIPLEALRSENKGGITRALAAGEKLYLPFEARHDWDRSDRAPANDADLAFGSVKYQWPVEGRLSSYFGKRKRRGRKMAMHEGIDIAAAKGTPVVAARSGHVIYAGNRIAGYGNLVIIRHADRYSTVYAHLTKIGVTKGQFVSRGEKLGTVGNTGRSHGAHLHFEVRAEQTPVDPLLFLQGQYATHTIGR